MITTYHFDSALDIDLDILDDIKSLHKSNSIDITIEDDGLIDLPEELKLILDERISENDADYLTADESINLLKNKYGV
jgi:hypothetical protein